MSKERYEVRDCVCDYAIYAEDKFISKELIFDTRKNAQAVCDIMNLDWNKEVVKAENNDISEEVKEEILKEYAEDLYEEFSQIARCEGKITMKDVVDVLQLNESEVEQ
ncbi:hypothetical protein [Clostridium butyricum]|uniref:Uncharacterized protein n=1 Tax=Clostridium butyricum E4 str. BoNT E BL5262 TaxID=632245 RepID=C4IGT4_CLOBU|nr:hypothetical protein [Clostridium butyricum]EDT74781.1 hypothetical protein CBY_2566 [Clostridium butyricum 5521]EEP53449.1 hypothetical protein CLP_2628 [Clostridium butyricum E4 str. BoNT E BL5262]NFL30503.1 hypothetical protein [Clostridium butyricum]NFS19458.1 hypothetical protein [Clostridium butyricum]